MSEIEKLDLKSMDIPEEKLKQLKALFPEVFTEGNKIDFEKLKLTLGETVDVGKERFGMNWPGKADCFKIIQQPSIATLLPCREESVNFDETENLFIEGDNLEVLKLLQKSYLGKIKMIYIDPPYNTGNDFIYPDDYSETLDTYLRYTGQIDSEGRKYSTNVESDGRFHSKWMNMMYPRLFLARNLLHDDGVIFISIDDKEEQNLKKIMDEIWGEETFIGQFIWKSRQNKDNRNITGASIDHEYVLCYGRRVRGDERKLEQYSNPDGDPRGDWTSGNMVGLLPENLRPNCHFDLINPETNINYGKPPLGWRYDKNTMNRLIEEKRIIWPSFPDGRPRRKVFLVELKNKYTGYSSIIGDNIYTRHGSLELEEIFGKKVMEFPKPSDLIKELMVQGSESGDIILDFFAGSATTAHATIKLNSENSKCRKYICIQLPEPLPEDSIAFQEGYRNIADLGKERIRKVSKNLIAQMENNPELFVGDFKKLDLGFKVFKLNSSNFRLWNSEVEKDKTVIEEQLDMHVDHIDKERTQEDILYEILLKSGFELTTKIEQKILEGKTIFSIAEGDMLICLEKELTPEVIKAMAELVPKRVVCLDEGFKGNDQLKTNAVQIMKSKNVQKFQTV